MKTDCVTMTPENWRRVGEELAQSLDTETATIGRNLVALERARTNTDHSRILSATASAHVRQAMQALGI